MSLNHENFPPPAIVLQKKAKRKRQILFPPQTSPISNHILWSVEYPFPFLSDPGTNMGTLIKP